MRFKRLAFVKQMLIGRVERKVDEAVDINLEKSGHVRKERNRG